MRDGQPPYGIQILVFNMLGTRFGIDAEQVERIEDPGMLEGFKGEVCCFRRKMGFRDPVSLYGPAKVVIPKSGPAAIVIDQLEDIVFLGIDEIRRIPSLMRGGTEHPICWGIGLTSLGLIFLVNLDAATARP